MILIFMPYGLFILVFFFLINKHFLYIFNGRFTKERRKKKSRGGVDLCLGGPGGTFSKISVGETSERGV